MGSAAWLLALVYTVYNVVFYTVVIKSHIYSIAWAPDVFLVSYLLLLTGSGKTRPHKIAHAFWVCVVALPGGSFLFAFLFTGELSGGGAYLLNDVVFVLLCYPGLLFLRQCVSFLSVTDIRTSFGYLVSYFLLIFLGLTTSLLSIFPVSVFSGIPLYQVQQLFLSNVMAFFLFGVPVYFLWVNGFSFHLRMYQGQAVLSTIMLSVVFINPLMSTGAFNWVLWGGVLVTLLWRSVWCQLIIFGLWGPLITQEFALKVKSPADYGFLLFVIMTTQIMWLLFLNGELLYSSLREKIARQKKMLETDSLTGCLNRQGLFTLFDTQVQEIPCLGAGILDINHFKVINDTMGHDAGDRVLQIVANRLAGCMGGKNRVARLGGDEFAFLIPGDESVIREKCRLFQLQLSERPVVISGQRLYVGVSLGFSRFPQDGNTAEQLLQKADTAMYRVKRQRTQENMMYTPGMEGDTGGTQGAAFFSYSAGEVIPACFAVYQPVYHVPQMRIHSVEALIRHPTISTSDLVAWAESYGHLDAMLEHMLRQSIPVIRELSLTVSLNISPTQLQAPDSLLHHLSLALNEEGLSRRVNLEITETVAIAEPEQFRASLAWLREKGFKISLDDFGAGFAFFETLNIGYFDIIKLDRSLVSDIHYLPQKQVLVQSIVQYAGGLNIMVVAEGVEVRAEVDYLLSAGVEYMQGFYFSRPLSHRDLHLLYLQDMSVM
ncbi:EAL domain-containing protein [Salmonella enterica subsp. enterica serovar Newport]|nr:EAL domain-containing protein [Salmonella enterica subsp. enterica serovar Newport]MJR82214.1 hypothetical protein [Salmonella enterica subsp. enterica serovar Newport]HAE2415176.1 EAL domain-containing protein [Salmonella enterica subsp. enterica serovar Newport]